MGGLRQSGWDTREKGGKTIRKKQKETELQEGRRKMSKYGLKEERIGDGWKERGRRGEQTQRRNERKRQCINDDKLRRREEGYGYGMEKHLRAPRLQR